MKSFTCPHCGKKAVPLWQLFVFPSPFWLNRKCSHCHTKLRFNFTTLGWIAASIVLWVIIVEVALNPFYQWIGIEGLFLVDIIAAFLIIFWPIWVGMKIFSE